MHNKDDTIALDRGRSAEWPVPELVRSIDPFSAETPLSADTTTTTPNELFYVRNHFPVPEPPTSVMLDGHVARPRRFSLRDLQAFPHKTATVTLECAGNGRVYLDPPARGVQWHLGAVANARWTGVALADLLESVGVAESAEEVVFDGADRGIPEHGDREIPYQRSLRLDIAMHGDILVAFEMNGEPLPLDHGGPVRLIVPRWYGMASVKWLERISVLAEPFQGYFQVKDYVLPRADGGEPCREMEVRALITSPAQDSVITAGRIDIAGYCWSGYAPVSAVQVSTDGGTSWNPAEIRDADPSPYAWAPWQFRWYPEPGAHKIVARAFDGAGNAQPLDTVWNSVGYKNNGAVPVRVTVK